MDEKTNSHKTIEVLDRMPEQMRWAFMDELIRLTKNET